MFRSLDVSLPGPVLPGVDVGALREGARGASEGNHPVLSQVTNLSPLCLLGFLEPTTNLLPI